MKKGFALPLIVGLVLSIALLGIVVYWKFIVPEQNHALTNKPISKIDKVSSWETFPNETDQYSIKVPTDWDLSFSKLGVEGGPPFSGQPIDIDPPGNPTVNGIENGTVIGFMIRRDPNSSSWAKCNGDSETRIDGVKGFKYKKIFIDEKTNLPEYAYIQSCVVKGDYTYHIQFIDKDYSNEKLYDQVISTFKFTN